MLLLLIHRSKGGLARPFSLSMVLENVTCRKTLEHRTSGRKGFYVRRLAPENSRSRSDLIRYFHQLSVSVVWKGMTAGISSEEMGSPTRSPTVDALIFSHT
jgi:hypothetical protein